MATPQKFVLRVFVATDIAMKLTLTERPQSVEELQTIMQERFKPRLDGDFTLQYEDPDFDGQLSLLVDIQELPEKGTLKVMRSENDSSSTASSDTDILPHVPLTQRQKNWPDCFPLPAFSFEVEHVLQEGNTVFESSGKTVKLTRSQKHNILENMAETMYSFKPYPNDREVGMAAEALVTANPCLREPGSRNGWYGWKFCLKFKMGNYRTKLARSGCAEVSINAGRRSRTHPESEPPHFKIKRARRAEVNYLPDFPRGENQTSLEKMRQEVIQEVEKTDNDQMLIEKLMQMTFALRRKEIVQGSPQVRDFLERWPALKIESQVFAEFHRITNVNLRNTFYSQLDRHTPTLLALYRQKASGTGKTAEALLKILRIYDQQETHDVNMRRSLALRALPLYLREDDSEFFKTYNWEDEPDLAETPVGLLSLVTENSTGNIEFNADSISVVIEDDLVVRGLTRLGDALVILFGLIYALHLDYPKKLIHTFTFVQKILMCLDDNRPLKPCLLSLKNELFKV